MLNVIENQSTWSRWLPWSARDKLRWVSYDDNDPAISSDVFRGAGEYIEIFDPSPQIDKLFALLSIKNVLRCYSSSSGYGTSVQINPRGNHASNNIAINGAAVPRTERISCRECGISNLTVSIHSQLSGWCLSTIPQHRSESPVIQAGSGILAPFRINTSGKDSGALVRYQSVLCDLGLISYRAPLFGGVAGVNNRSESDHDSREAIRNLEQTLPPRLIAFVNVLVEALSWAVGFLGAYLLLLWPWKPACACDKDADPKCQDQREECA